ncbi:MAG: hypothetical protein P4K86_13935 [Terracidiphilus sp.]|nr:hypothetical protein [Terracidiphilus sp.]MDR3775493.1 hypothetical protein [Terracidiphilus sp.]
MSLGSRFAQEIAPPFSALDAAAIREQLQRLLAHPLFSNSKRYPVLLAYTVEETLKGNGADLKERSIGIEVFGRSPSYDANADPVVRITAGEVRKRLMQYYYDSTHDGELVVELPVGSYVPLFHAAEPVSEPELFLPAPELPAQTAAPVPALDAPRPAHRLLWALVGAMVLLAGAVSVDIVARRHDAPPPPNSLDRFWAPITAGSSTATYCLGEPAKDINVGSINSLDTPAAGDNPEPLYFRLHYSGLFAMADIITLTHTAATLEARHKAFRVVPASGASFAQLREGPIVLIGAFDNIWTLRVTQKLRFGFESKDGVAVLVDRKSKTQTTWATAWDLPYEKLSRDYAIVARIHDSLTGQPMIIAAGISEEGTEAAGEILYNPVYLEALLAKVPANWEQMNIEAVIETQVIQGHPGPPTVLAVEAW